MPANDSDAEAFKLQSLSLMRESWTDARLDDLNRKVDDLGRRMDRGFERVDARLDAMQRLMVQFCGGFVAALVGLIAATLGSRSLEVTF